MWHYCFPLNWKRSKHFNAANRAGHFGCACCKCPWIHFSSENGTKKYGFHNVNAVDESSFQMGHSSSPQASTEHQVLQVWTYSPFLIPISIAIAVWTWFLKSLQILFWVKCLVKYFWVINITMPWNCRRWKYFGQKAAKRCYKFSEEISWNFYSKCST